MQNNNQLSYLIQVRGLKQELNICVKSIILVVPYIGTWIETFGFETVEDANHVVPYIGTWIETVNTSTGVLGFPAVVPYIGTWIETSNEIAGKITVLCRTLYRYVD